MRHGWLMVPAVAALVITGCSGEDVAENLIERQIENESGEDVDIDLDDGNIRIEGEDGEIQFNVDDDGNVSVEGLGEDGEFSIESDGDQTVIETEDGQMVMSDSGDLPEGWPSEIPIPEGLTVQLAQSSEGTQSVTGALSGDGQDAFTAYADSLRASGFDDVFVTVAEGASSGEFDNGTWTVGLFVVDLGDGEAQVSIGVNPSGG